MNIKIVQTDIKYSSNGSKNSSNEQNIVQMKN